MHVYMYIFRIYTMYQYIPVNRDQEKDVFPLLLRGLPVPKLDSLGSWTS